MKQLARDLRRRQTDAEQKLWWSLRDRQLSGYKFRRQHPIGPYVVDFCCLEQKFVIELDGSHHMKQAERDEKRTQYLIQEGYRVLRFWDNQVLNEFEGVLEAIRFVLENPHPNPLPERERERV